MRVLPVALAVLMAAGCLTAGGDRRPDYEGTEEEANAAAELFLVQDHGDAAGHFDSSQHVGAFNLELVGYHNGMPGAGQDPNDITAGGAYNELVVTDEYVYVSRSSADGTFGGFTILSHKDRDDPAKLTYVGEFDAQHGVDIEVNADETLAFLATQRNSQEQMLGAVQATQNPTSATPRGIYVVNIEDKKAPVLESFVPLPANGPHTMTYYATEDAEFLIVCTYDLITDPGTGALLGVVPVTQRMLVYEIMSAPPEAPLPVPTTLVPVSQFQITTSAPAGKLYFPHDTRVQAHPTYGGGTDLLYVAYWDKGVRVLDFSDPRANPLPEVGFFTEFGPTALNNIHLTQPFGEEIDGFHVTVSQPEIPSAPDETGQVTFIDTTDPVNPTQLGYWTLPNGTTGRLGIAGFDFSPHNFDLWAGKMAIGHFHAGIWVVDVSDEENLRDPKTVGYYMPSKPRSDAPTMQPAVWGVFEHQGLLWASDESTGIYVLRYTGP